MELVLLKWKRSQISDTYGLSVWVRNRMSESVRVAMEVRS